MQQQDFLNVLAITGGVILPQETALERNIVGAKAFVLQCITAVTKELDL